MIFWKKFMVKSEVFMPLNPAWATLYLRKEQKF